MLFILLSINNKRIDWLFLLTVSNNIYILFQGPARSLSTRQKVQFKNNLTRHSVGFNRAAHGFKMAKRKTIVSFL